MTELGFMPFLSPSPVASHKKIREINKVKRLYLSRDAKVYRVNFRRRYQTNSQRSH